MTPTRIAYLAILVVATASLTSGPVRAGDPEVAKLIYRKAEKEFRAKRYEQAAKLYRRVLAEHSPYPEAACGLGSALEKMGKGNAALQAYLQCRKQVRAIPKPSSRQKNCARRAEKAISRLGKAYSEVEKLEERFIKECLAYGGKHGKSSPGWSRRAYEAVLALDPQNAVAAEAVKELANIQRLGQGFGRPELLVKKGSMSGWDCGQYSSRWTCSGRVITGDRKSPGIVCYRSGIYMRGTYRLTVTARVVERYGPDWYWGFKFGVNTSEAKTYSFGYGYAHDVYLIRAVGTDRRDLWDKPKTQWDPKEWHTLRVDVTPGKVTCFADGEEVFSHEAELDRDFEGTMGLNLRSARIEFKDVKVYR